VSRAKKSSPVTTTAGHKGEIIKAMRGLSHRHDLWSVFSDFVEIGAISIANTADRSNPQWQQREDRYMQIIKGYTPEEQAEFPRMLYHLVEALACGMDDVLGEVFMELELGNKWTGQFFTPYEVCQLMARMTAGDLKPFIEQQGFVTVNEPACGGGAMIIAMADELHSQGINYQQCMHVTAQDLDLKAVQMAYLQFSLLHIPAIVIHGNTLALEERSHWNTPAHIMGGWEWKLRIKRKPMAPVDDPAQAEASVPEPVATPMIVMQTPAQWQQAGLF
jgi:hypothetical protein